MALPCPYEIYTSHQQCPSVMDSEENLPILPVVRVEMLTPRSDRGTYVISPIA
ncbi:hypothetical protein H6F93_30445 [Leptolyngbya sp. FACHB-671]|nr:hypothetical protein [Leptolyngbya sp. FACHB-671]